MNTRHTLSVLVENKPGVLTRVAALFARRAFNIHSLAVGETEDPQLSRITVVVDAAERPLEQVTKQLNKLVNVLKIVELEPESTVERQLLLVTVLQVVDLFRAHVVDVGPAPVTIAATGSVSKVRAFLSALEPYGIREIVQSGAVAIGRGSRSLSERVSAELSLLRA